MRGSKKRRRADPNDSLMDRMANLWPLGGDVISPISSAAVGWPK